jgi:hypothetical protein
MMRNVISKKFDLKEDYKYPLFLIALASFLFIPSFAGGDDSKLLINILFLFFIICSLLLISARSRVIKTFTYIIGILGISAEFYHQFISPIGNSFQVLFMLLMFIYLIMLFTELISQIFRSDIITLNIVLGAFTGYIIIGIIGYFIFRIIFILDPSSFVLSLEEMQNLLYFSFITLTTIGYGDISPLSDAARNFAIILGLVGQFYNSIIIAIIIGKFLQK